MRHESRGPHGNPPGHPFYERSDRARDGDRRLSSGDDRDERFNERLDERFRNERDRERERRPKVGRPAGREIEADNRFSHDHDDRAGRSWRSVDRRDRDDDPFISYIDDDDGSYRTHGGDEPSPPQRIDDRRFGRFARDRPVPPRERGRVDRGDAYRRSAREDDRPRSSYRDDRGWRPDDGQRGDMTMMREEQRAAAERLRHDDEWRDRGDDRDYRPRGDSRDHDPRGHARYAPEPRRFSHDDREVYDLIDGSEAPRRRRY